MSKAQKIWFAFWLMAAPLLVSSGAQIIGGLPFTLTNGTVADATQVMADFNQIVNNTNANAAKNGVNADITALSALATPLTNVQGGTTLFIGPLATGTANAQIVATPVPTGLALANKPTLYFLPVATNTGATTLNANSTGATNIFRPSFSGPVALTGGEIVLNQLTQVSYDGTRWLLAADMPQFGISTNLASAGTTDLGTVASHVVQITGTTGITAFGSTASVDAPVYKLRFSGALTITHNGTSLILPGSLPITTVANDTATALYLGSGNWQIIQYQPVSGVSVIPSVTNVQNFTVAGANTWTRTAGVTEVYVYICGGGGGGGGGHRSAGGALGTGGSAGGGAACASQYFKAADAGTSQTVTLGAAGTAGTGATVNGNAGTSGGVGGNTTFGALLTAFGGGGGSSSTAGASGGGGGGYTTAGTTAAGITVGQSEYVYNASGNAAACAGAVAGVALSAVACVQGGSGGGGSSTTGANVGGPGANSPAHAPGGGGGGGHVAGNTGQAGGASGKTTGCPAAAAGGAVNTVGTSTAATFNYMPGCGGGGGGGANGTPASGGNGGAGTNGGGGGGGGSGNAANAGNGGVGGTGFALVVSW